MPKRETSELFRMTRPSRFAAAMVLFLIAAALIAAAMMDRVMAAFSANYFLNGLIVTVLLVGIVYTFSQVFRLTPSVRWIENYRMEDLGGLGPQDYAPPELLAPMAAMLRDRDASMSLSATALGSILDSIGSRLDESREISRYMIGLLVFLGLLGTFWGLLATISAVSASIGSLNTTGGPSGQVFEELIAGLEAPLSGMAIAFSSSLFGLSGSLILGFLDLRAGQAQNRFYNELEEYLSTRTQITSGHVPPGGGGGGHTREETLSALYGAARALENAIVNLDTKGELVSSADETSPAEEPQPEGEAESKKVEDLSRHRSARKAAPEAVERLLKAVDEDDAEPSTEEDAGENETVANAVIKSALADYRRQRPIDGDGGPKGATQAPIILDTVATDQDSIEDIRNDIRVLTKTIVSLADRKKG